MTFNIAFKQALKKSRTILPFFTLIKATENKIETKIICNKEPAARDLKIFSGTIPNIKSVKLKLDSVINFTSSAAGLESIRLCKSM